MGEGACPALGGARRATNKPRVPRTPVFNFKSKQDMLEWPLHARLRWPTMSLICKPRVDTGPAPQSPSASSAPPRHPHTRPRAASYSWAPPIRRLLPWPYIHVEPASPRKERESGGVGRAVPTPRWLPQRSQACRLAPGTLLQAGDLVGPSATLRPSGAVPRPLPFRARHVHRPSASHPGPVPSASPSPGSRSGAALPSLPSRQPHHEPPPVLLPRPGPYPPGPSAAGAPVGRTRTPAPSSSPSSFLSAGTSWLGPRGSGPASDPQVLRPTSAPWDPKLASGPGPAPGWRGPWK